MSRLFTLLLGAAAGAAAAHFLDPDSGSRRRNQMRDQALSKARSGKEKAAAGASFATGKAKGIMNSNRGVCLQLWRWHQWYDIKPEHPPRTWSANGCFWSGNFCQAFGGTLSSGGTLLLQRWFDPAEALELMDKERCSMPLAWPHQWPQHYWIR